MSEYQLSEAARRRAENPIFTRRHYQAIAACVSESKGDWTELMVCLSRMFAADNPAFNVKKFMDACE